MIQYASGKPMLPATGTTPTHLEEPITGESYRGNESPPCLKVAPGYPFNRRLRWSETPASYARRLGVAGKT